MRRTQHVTRRHRQTGGRSRAYARGASGEDGAAGCTTCTSTGVHNNVRPKKKKNDNNEEKPKEGKDTCKYNNINDNENNLSANMVQDLLQRMKQ